MNREEALRFLDDPARYGSDTNPQLLRAALKKLGSPESGLTLIHLAGTNGKGSTGAFLCSLLEAGGERAGHFTSPHVSDFLERIRIDGKNCEKDLFVRAVSEVRSRLSDLEGFSSLRAFSLQMFTALVAFRMAGVRFAVMEAGIGGRDDATNILIPRVCAITPIGLDHTGRLGNTVAAIARHKAGIIKPGIPVFSGMQTEPAARVLTETARVNAAPLTFLRPEHITVLRSDEQGVSFLWDRSLPLSTVMGGEYQAANAGLAILVARHLLPVLSDAAVEEGIRRASMPGRRQLVAENPAVIVDGAHNRHAIAAFCAESRAKDGQTGIIGMMADKETEEILTMWRQCFSTLYLVPVADERSWDPDRVKAEYCPDDPGVIATRSLKEALARAETDAPGAIYIMGSLYLAGEALALFSQTDKE